MRKPKGSEMLGDILIVKEYEVPDYEVPQVSVITKTLDRLHSSCLLVVNHQEPRRQNQGT